MKIVELDHNSIEQILLFEQQHAPDKPDYFRAEKSFLTHLFNNPDKGKAIGVYEDDQLIGWGSYLAEKEDDVFEVSSVVVHTEHRRKGIGKLILDTLVLDLKTKPNIKRIFLTVYPENKAALSLYLQSGFDIEERIDNKYGPGMHRLVLSLSL